MAAGQDTAQQKMLEAEKNTHPHLVKHQCKPLCANTAYSCNKLWLFLYTLLYLVSKNSVILVITCFFVLFFFTLSFLKRKFSSFSLSHSFFPSFLSLLCPFFYSFVGKTTAANTFVFLYNVSIMNQSMCC